MMQFLGKESKTQKSWQEHEKNIDDAIGALTWRVTDVQTSWQQ